jgi:Rieske Fe-S protein
MKRYSTIMSVLLTLALPVAGSCADAPTAPEKADSAAKIEAVSKSMSKSKHSGMMGGAVPAAGTAAANPSGKVVETMNGGGYTYASLEKDGKKTWVAYSTLETRVGDTLSFTGCMEMPNFQSKALSRTFESILFCGQPEVKANPAAKKDSAKKSPGSGGAIAAAGKIQVEKASGANAYTVAEIFAKRGPLNGKHVVVKGQVVKVGSGIMDRNWIHLQDGSGTEKQKNHDLVVTSKELPEIGDVVTVSGTLAKDKDFGSGYKYNVILEKGSLKK